MDDDVVSVSVNDYDDVDGAWMADLQVEEWAWHNLLLTPTRPHTKLGLSLAPLSFLASHSDANRGTKNYKTIKRGNLIVSQNNFIHSKNFNLTNQLVQPTFQSILTKIAKSLISVERYTYYKKRIALGVFKFEALKF